MAIPSVESDQAAAEAAARSTGCTPSVAVPPLPRAEAQRLAKLLKALADPTRLQLIALIEATPGGEACVCDLAAPFDYTQPTISHHLKVLLDVGLLSRDKRGSWAWYSLVPEQWEPLRHFLTGFGS